MDATLAGEYKELGKTLSCIKGLPAGLGAAGENWYGVFYDQA